MAMFFDTERTRCSIFFATVERHLWLRVARSHVITIEFVATSHKPHPHLQISELRGRKSFVGLRKGKIWSIPV